MKMLSSFLFAACTLFSAVADTAPRIIVDADIGSSTDDLFALQVVKNMERKGLATLIGVMIDRPCAADDASDKFRVFTGALLHSEYYDWDDVPIGTIPQLPPGTAEHFVYTPYWQLSFATNHWEKPLLPPPETRSGLVTNAIALYRKLLSESPSNSVEIVSLGFVTNLTMLLDTPADDYSDLDGKELIRQKVRNLRIMGGCFDNSLSHPDYNTWGDVSGARRIYGEWPTPIVVAPAEIGNKLYVPRRPVLNMYGGCTNHPLYLVYSNWEPDVDVGKKSQLLWDVFPVLSIAEPSLLDRTPPGEVEVYEILGIDGYTRFVERPDGKACVLSMPSTNKVGAVAWLRPEYEIIPPSVGDKNLRISAVHFDDDENGGSFICIQNRGFYDTSLAGCRLTCGRPEWPLFFTYEFPENTILAPSETIRLTGKDCWPEVSLVFSAVHVILWSADYDIIHEAHVNPYWFWEESVEDALIVGYAFSQLQVDQTDWRVGHENAYFTEDNSVRAAIRIDEDGLPVVSRADGSSEPVTSWSCESIVSPLWITPGDREKHHFFRLTK